MLRLSDGAGRMDFVHKNFKFKTMSLAELVGRCTSAEEFPPLVAAGERYAASPLITIGSLLNQTPALNTHFDTAVSFGRQWQVIP